MGSIGDTAGAPRRAEQGYTLIELLVAATVGMVVLGGAVTIFLGAVRSEPRTASKVTAIQQGRVAVERITRELRQGLDVPTATAGELAVVTYVKQSSCGGSPADTSIACRVTYTCTAGECSRTVAQPDGSSPGAATQVVSGLSSTEVFSYSPSAAEPAYVDVALSFTAREGGPVAIADGVALRNGGS
ncbi:MAG: prepilin-type N-terminal cleavage/methylation domain-containing protein [Solirubrobacterales bacterium]